MGIVWTLNFARPDSTTWSCSRPSISTWMMEGMDNLPRDKARDSSFRMPGGQLLPWTANSIISIAEGRPWLADSLSAPSGSRMAMLRRRDGLVGMACRIRTARTARTAKSTWRLTNLPVQPCNQVTTSQPRKLELPPARKRLSPARDSSFGGRVGRREEGWRP